MSLLKNIYDIIQKDISKNETEYNNGKLYYKSKFGDVQLTKGDKSIPTLSFYEDEKLETIRLIKKSSGEIAAEYLSQDEIKIEYIIKSIFNGVNIGTIKRPEPKKEIKKYKGEDGGDYGDDGGLDLDSWVNKLLKDDGGGDDDDDDKKSDYHDNSGDEKDSSNKSSEYHDFYGDPKRIRQQKILDEFERHNPHPNQDDPKYKYGTSDYADDLIEWYRKQREFTENYKDSDSGYGGNGDDKNNESWKRDDCETEYYYREYIQKNNYLQRAIVRDKFYSEFEKRFKYTKGDGKPHKYECLCDICRTRRLRDSEAVKDEIKEYGVGKMNAVRDYDGKETIRINIQDFPHELILNPYSKSFNCEVDKEIENVHHEYEFRPHIDFNGIKNILSVEKRQTGYFRGKKVFELVISIWTLEELLNSGIQNFSEDNIVELDNSGNITGRALGMYGMFFIPAIVIQDHETKYFRKKIGGN